jgi:hypothetical protein
MKSTRFALALGAVALLGAGAPSRAHAFTDGIWCTTGGFQACASVATAGWGTGTITMTVTNLGGTGSHTITALGFHWLGLGSAPSVPFGVTGAIAGYNPLRQWTPGNQGLPEAEIGANAPPPPVGDGRGVQPSESITLTFTFDDVLVRSEWGFAMHTQAIDPNLYPPGSIKCVEGTPNCETNVVPEPVTMILLGSGLAGMGGMGVIRRRKKDGDIESA